MSQTRVTPITVQASQLQPGDILADANGKFGADHVTNPAAIVAGVQILGPVTIVDFCDNTATPPINSATPARVIRGEVTE